LQAEQAQATPDQAIINELEGKIFTSAQNTNSAFLLLDKENKSLRASLSELISENFWQERQKQADEYEQKLIADLKNVVSAKREVIWSLISQLVSLNGSPNLTRRDSLLDSLHSRQNSISNPLPTTDEVSEATITPTDYQVDLKKHLQKLHQSWTNHLNQTQIELAYQSQEEIITALIPSLEQCLTAFTNPQELAKTVTDLLNEWNIHYQWQDGLKADKFWSKHLLTGSKEEQKITNSQIKILGIKISGLEASLREITHESEERLARIHRNTQIFTQELVEAKLRKDKQYSTYLDPDSKKQIMEVAEKKYHMVNRKKYNEKKTELKEIKESQKTLTQLKETLSQELANLKTKQESLLTLQQQIIQENKSLTDKLDLAEQKQEELEITVLQAQDEANRYSEKIVRLERNNSSFDIIYNDYVGQNSQLQDEVNLLKRKIADLEQIIVDLKEEQNSGDNLTVSSFNSDFGLDDLIGDQTTDSEEEKKDNNQNQLETNIEVSN
jgi:hypothetical protein